MSMMMFEICEFMKNIKIYISWERNKIFSLNIKIHLLDIKGYIVIKNNLLAEITFKYITHTCLIRNY